MKPTFADRDRPQLAQVTRKPTERQLEVLTDLWGQRVHELGEDVPDDMTFDDASGFIDHLLNYCPRKPRGEAQAAHGIRAGHYAWADAEGTVHFYEVARNGRIYVQAGPARHPYNGKLNEALEAIKADPKSAAALYGTKIGRCGRCHLELTDEDSRARGLGPKCASKSDW